MRYWNIYYFHERTAISTKFKIFRIHFWIPDIVILSFNGSLIVRSPSRVKCFVSIIHRMKQQFFQVLRDSDSATLGYWIDSDSWVHILSLIPSLREPIDDAIRVCVCTDACCVRFSRAHNTTTVLRAQIESQCTIDSIFEIKDAVRTLSLLSQ